MDALAIILIVLAAFAITAAIFVALGVLLIFMGPPDLHDVDIDPHQSTTPNTKRR